MVATFFLTSSQVHGGAAAGGVNLDLDGTVFVQVGFLILLWVVLKPVLFDPMLKLFEEREERIEGAIKKARRIDERSARAKAERDEGLAKARAEGNAEREKLRAEGLKKESELLAKVRAETQKSMDEARAAAEQEVAATRAALVPQTQTLAKDLASRVLGRTVS